MRILKLGLGSLTYAAVLFALAVPHPVEAQTCGKCKKNSEGCCNIPTGDSCGCCNSADE